MLPKEETREIRGALKCEEPSGANLGKQMKKTVLRSEEWYGRNIGK